MSDVIRSRSHQQTDVDSVAGPDAYTQGGATVSTNLGRVDEADASVNDETYQATVTGVSNNTELTVVITNADGSGEVAADTDLSGVEITYEAYRL